jgi:hypothetical protein
VVAEELFWQSPCSRPRGSECVCPRSQQGDQRPSSQRRAFSRHVRGALCRTCGTRPDVLHIPTRYVGYFCGECCAACRETPAATDEAVPELPMRYHLLPPDVESQHCDAGLTFYPSERGIRRPIPMCFRRPLQMLDHALPKQGSQGLRPRCRIQIRRFWRVDRVRRDRADEGVSACQHLQIASSPCRKLRSDSGARRRL